MGDFIPYQHEQLNPSQSLDRARQYHELMHQRRTIREFSDEPVPFEVMQHLIMTASSAPSGAHKQPWTFCLVGDAGVKKQIREAAEEEERINYEKRMSEQWKADLAKLGTGPEKPFLEMAPWLVVVFKKPYDLVDGGKHPNYSVNESVGLACGFLLTAIHNARLAAVTHTPSPMDFLKSVLDRPSNERPFLLIPVGYPAENAEVPNLERKSFEEVCVVY
jgi:nitroreductase